MIPNEVKDIVLGVLKKSREKKVNWLQGSEFDPNVNSNDEDFYVNTPNSSINIFFVYYEGVSGISINFLNNSGEVFLSIHVDENEEDYAIMKEILELAKAKVNKSEEILRNIRNALNDPGTLGASDDIPF